MTKPSRKNKTISIIIFAVLAAAFLVLAVLRLISTGSPQDEKPSSAVVPAVSSTAVPASAADATPVPAPTPEGIALTPEPTATPEPEPEYYTVSMVGDCTLSSSQDKKGWAIAFESVLAGDYSYPFASTKEYLEDYLTIANLECNLSNKIYYSIEWFTFLSSSAYAQVLSEGSVEFVTLANNHTMDFGEAAYADTEAALDAVGVAYAGEDETYVYQDGDGPKIGLYCLYNQLTYNAYTLLSSTAQDALVKASREKIDKAVETLKNDGCEFIIACLHMGREGFYEPTELQMEMCRYAVDAGFGAVYCTHAHRLQPAELYNDGIIFYGMGNWTFGGHTNPGNGTDAGSYDTGIAQIVLKKIGDRVELDSYSFVPCSISSQKGINNYQPTPYEEGSAEYERAMSMLNGTYEGANYTVDYGNVLSAMNG